MMAAKRILFMVCALFLLGVGHSLAQDEPTIDRKRMENSSRPKKSEVSSIKKVAASSASKKKKVKPSVPSKKAEPYLKISSQVANFDADGGSYTFVVSSSSPWDIIRDTTASWGSIKRNDDTLTLRVGANTSTSPRNDGFYIANETSELCVDIYQQGKDFLEISPQYFYLPQSGGSYEFTCKHNTKPTYSPREMIEFHGRGDSEDTYCTIALAAYNKSGTFKDTLVLRSGKVENSIYISQQGSRPKKLDAFSVDGTAMYSTGYIVQNSDLRARLDSTKDYHCNCGSITEHGSAVVAANGSFSFYNVSGALDRNLEIYRNASREIDKHFIKNWLGILNRRRMSRKEKAMQLREERRRFDCREGEYSEKLKCEIDIVAITDTGYYCIVNKLGDWEGNVPEKMKAELEQCSKLCERIKSISICENGEYAIITNRACRLSRAGDRRFVEEAQQKYGDVKNVCVTNNGICVVCERGVCFSNIPVQLAEALSSLDFNPDFVTFTDSGTYFISKYESGQPTCVYSL